MENIEFDTIFKISDIVKSNFNGVISIITETGWEDNSVSLETAIKSQNFKFANDEEIKEFKKLNLI